MIFHTLEEAIRAIELLKKVAPAKYRFDPDYWYGTNRSCGICGHYQGNDASGGYTEKHKPDCPHVELNKLLDR